MSLTSVSLGHHVRVVQAPPAPARLDLVRAEVVGAAAPVQFHLPAQAGVRGGDVVVAAPQRPWCDALRNCLQARIVYCVGSL